MTSSNPAARTPAPRVAAAVLIALALTLLGGCVRIPINEDTLFQPKESVTIDTFDHPEATLQEVFFESDDGTRINAWYLSPPCIDHFLEQGVSALFVDYRSYGRSEEFDAYGTAYRRLLNRVVAQPPGRGPTPE